MCCRSGEEFLGEGARFGIDELPLSEVLALILEDLH